MSGRDVRTASLFAQNAGRDVRICGGVYSVRDVVISEMRFTALGLTFLLVASVAHSDSSWVRKPEVTLKLVNVSKWTYSPPDFPSGHAIAKPTPKDKISLEELAERIQNTIAKHRWDPRDGWSLQHQNGFLIVRAPAYVHAAIDRYIARLGNQ